MSAQTRARAALGAGGAALALGAVAPWMTLFAGLQRYTGLIGANGRILLVAGLAGVIVSAAPAPWRDRRTARWLFAGALAAAAFCAWLIVGLVEMVHRSSMAMLIPGMGPGLFIALAGALLCLGGAYLALGNGARPEAG